MNELIEFSLDTENGEKNYNLAQWYERQGHTAPAHTYYLRAAERAEDNILVYRALIHASFCYKSQGSRDTTEKILLENALVLLPERPEAYYFLSLLYEKKGEWQNCYIYSTLGIKCYEKDIVSINIPEYDGKHLLIFQKATSSWNWGKGQESRDLFDYLYKNEFLNFTETHKNIILENMNKLNIVNSKYFELEYKKACETFSDISENLPILFNLAKECKHVTEMGVRTGVSTRAFLNTDTILRSYDLYIDDEVNDLFNKAKQFGKDVNYIQANVLDIEIEETDLLFIDTWHCYDQLKQELKIHPQKVRKYIAFHDTHTFGIDGEPYSITTENGYKEKPIGLLPAIIEFLIENPEWRFKIHKTNNNGLTVIERV
jgi:hypothetical protein